MIWGVIKSEMANTRPEDWGELRVVKVTRGDDFWSLFDELNNDESGFVHNRNWLVDGFREGRVYSLVVIDTESMDSRKAYHDEIFAKQRDGMGDTKLYMLPCLCMTERGKRRVADILWVHTRARKLGLARALLDKLKINQSDSIGEAVGFWEAMGFRKSDENAYSRDLTRMIRGPRRRSRN